MNLCDNTIFFDALITNNVQGNKQPIPAYYSCTRTMPLINDTTDYMLSIIRFTIDTTMLPVWLPQIQTNQGNINLTTNSITMSYTDPNSNKTITYQQYMIFVPQDSSAQLPSPPSSNQPYYLQDNSTGYYNVYNYQYLIYLINQTFESCLTNLQILANNNDVILPDNVIAPNMTFDNSSQLASININADNYGITSSKINIYFNSALMELFVSLPFQRYGVNAQNGMNFMLNNLMGSDPTIIQQEYSTVANWCPITSIVFTTSLIPVISNQVGLPAIYNNGLLVSSTSNASSFNIITDLVADNFAFTPYIIYSPSIFRYISLLPNQKISQLDIAVYYQDRFGNLNPVLLPNNSSMTVKLLFSKLPIEK